MRTENRITDILLSECPRFYLDKIPSLLNGCWRGTNQRHLSKKLVLLALLVCEALSASCFLFLTETSCFWLRLLMHTSWDISTAFFSFSLMLSLRASSTQTFSFSIHFSLLHTSVSCFIYLLFLLLARYSFRLFPNFRWDALWGIHSDVTLPYLFERMFKTLRVFAPSSSEFIPFLTCHHSITDFESMHSWIKTHTDSSSLCQI